MSTAELERDFYRRQVDELGSLVLRLQEDQTRMRRELKRITALAHLVREGYRLSGKHASEKDTAKRFLETVNTILHATKVYIARITEQKIEIIYFNDRTGIKPANTSIELPSDPPHFSFRSSSSPRTPFTEVIADKLSTPFFLWAGDPEMNFGLLIGSTIEDQYLELPFREQDRELITGILDIFVEIKERKHLEEEIFKARKLETIGVLAGGIAHDFNNLLTGILGNVTLARIYGPSDERWLERIRESERAAERARTLTSQLLTFSKGGAPLRNAVSMDELIRESTQFALRGSNVRARYVIKDDLRAADIDADQISQVIHNIVLNGDQAMPNGGELLITVENIILSKDSNLPIEPGNYIRLSITDHGSGISHELQHRIFDPFFTTKEQGTGLGLTTSYSIVQKHGGIITVDSEENRGSTFTIYLPAARLSPPASERDTMQPVIKGSGRILLMDDEEIVRTVGSELLEHLGYDVTLAAEGNEALEQFAGAFARGKRFHIAILDLTVAGGVGGKEVARRLKAIDPEVKTVVSSGYSADPVMADYKRYGFDAMMPKPYSLTTLGDLLANLRT